MQVKRFSWVIEYVWEWLALSTSQNNVFLAFTKPYLQLFLRLPFAWQKSCIIA